MWITRLVDNRAWCFWLKLSTWARLTQHALLACASCDGPQKPDPDLSRVEQLLFRKNMKKLRWLFIWQITLSQFYNVSVRFKSASSGNKLEHLEDGLIISFFFVLPMRLVSVSVFFALGFVSPLVAAQVSAWGQCEYRWKHWSFFSSAYFIYYLLCGKVVVLVGLAELVAFQGEVSKGLEWWMVGSCWPIVVERYTCVSENPCAFPKCFPLVRDG